MEKNSETSEIRERNNKRTEHIDHTGHSEKEIDLDVDKRTGQVQQQKRAQNVTQKAIAMSRRVNTAFVGQKSAQSGKKKVVTVFQKLAAKKI